MRLDSPPSIREFLTKPEYFERALALMDRVADLNARYRPWRKVGPIARQRGLDPRLVWFALKLRRIAAQELPLAQANGRQFKWTPGNHLLEPLHRIDRAVGGGSPAVLSPGEGLLGDEVHRSRLRIRTLMDEATESSLIEGAATTRTEAVEMLRQDRAPKTTGERMVLNNYLAMQQIKRWIGRPLTPAMLIELQAILTAGTLENPDESGRFRRLGERVRVVNPLTHEEIFIPPPADALESRVEALCRFANAEHVGESFIHPIVKASILHFMIGYEHPFPDGNGRTARAVFYWYALRNSYTIFEFMPISELIRAGYAKYPQAYIDSELDDGDLTYFILYKLGIIERSIDAFIDRLKREEEKLRDAQRLLKLSKDLNLRQRLLLQHALRHPATVYTVKSHATSNGIVPATARADLDDLVRRRLMTTSKRGREVLYHVLPALKDRVSRKGI